MTFCYPKIMRIFRIVKQWGNVKEISLCRAVGGPHNPCDLVFKAEPRHRDA